MVHCLFDFLNCVSLMCVFVFFLYFNILLPFNGEIKMCVCTSLYYSLVCTLRDLFLYRRIIYIE